MKPILDQLMPAFSKALVGNAINPYNADKHVNHAFWQPTAYPAVNDLVTKLGVKITHKYTDHERFMQEMMNGTIAPNWNEETDKLQMLSPECFDTPAEYAATLLHELGHWTGYSTRTKRLVPDRQAAVENVEEITATMFEVIMADRLGTFTAEVERDATVYINDWASGGGTRPADIKGLALARTLAEQAVTWVDSKLKEV